MKNANGDGSLRQRKDGTWEYRISVEGRKTPLSFYSKDADGRGAKKKYREWFKKTGGKAVKGPKSGCPSKRQMYPLDRWHTGHTQITNVIQTTISSQRLEAKSWML